MSSIQSQSPVSASRKGRMGVMFSRPFSAVFALLVTLGAIGSQAGPITYKKETNISYSLDPVEEQTDYQKARCKLDLYYPEGRTGFATIVWFHGGGLTGGGKHFPGFRDKHMAMVGVNYRLYPKTPSCSNAISDAAAAVAWTFRNIETYGGDPTKIFVSGHSAGGYLTMMLGYDKTWLAKYNVDADAIKGLFPYSGHTITHMTVRKEKYQLSTKIPVIDAFAPIYHARPDAPPTLLLTGDRRLEILGRTEENELFLRVLKNVGHPDATLLEFEGYGHGMAHPAPPVALKWIERVLGCSPKALIVPLTYAWSFTKEDRKYPWKPSSTDPDGEPRAPIEFLSTGGRDDSGCLAVRDSSDKANAYGRSAVLPVCPGRGYVFTGWVKNEGKGESVAGVCINLASGSRITKQVKNAKLPATQVWTPFEISFSPIPEGTNGLVLYIVPRAPGQPKETTGAVLFDDLHIEEQAAASAAAE